MKKTVILFTAAVLSLSMFSACGTKSSSSSSSGSVSSSGESSSGITVSGDGVDVNLDSDGSSSENEADSSNEGNLSVVDIVSGDFEFQGLADDHSAEVLTSDGEVEVFQFTRDSVREKLSSMNVGDKFNCDYYVDNNTKSKIIRRIND